MVYNNIDLQLSILSEAVDNEIINFNKLAESVNILQENGLLLEAIDTNKIKEKIKEIFEKLKKIFNKIIDFIKAIIENAKNKIESFKNKIKSFNFNNMVSSIKNKFGNKHLSDLDNAKTSANENAFLAESSISENDKISDIVERNYTYIACDIELSKLVNKDTFGIINSYIKKILEHDLEGGGSLTLEKDEKEKSYTIAKANPFYDDYVESIFFSPEHLDSKASTIVKYYFSDDHKGLYVYMSNFINKNSIADIAEICYKNLDRDDEQLLMTYIYDLTKNVQEINKSIDEAYSKISRIAAEAINKKQIQTGDVNTPSIARIIPNAEKINGIQKTANFLMNDIRTMQKLLQIAQLRSSQSFAYLNLVHNLK